MIHKRLKLCADTDTTPVYRNRERGHLGCMITMGAIVGAIGTGAISGFAWGHGNKDLSYVIRATLPLTVTCVAIGAASTYCDHVSFSKSNMGDSAIYGGIVLGLEALAFGAGCGVGYLTK